MRFAVASRNVDYSDDPIWDVVDRDVVDVQADDAWVDG